MKTIKVVDFEYGEVVTALYIDDKLYKHGDHYHDKIKDFISGFIKGLEYAGVVFKYQGITIHEPNPWIDELFYRDGSPPERFQDIYKQPSPKWP